jgi:hypothetical protein
MQGAALLAGVHLLERLQCVLQKSGFRRSAQFARRGTYLPVTQRPDRFEQCARFGHTAGFTAQFTHANPFGTRWQQSIGQQCARPLFREPLLRELNKGEDTRGLPQTLAGGALLGAPGCAYRCLALRALHNHRGASLEASLKRRR